MVPTASARFFIRWSKDEKIDTVVQPDMVEMKDETAVGILPDIVIGWEKVTRRL